MAGTHDEAWRSAYQGIIPGAELEKLINRRGPALVGQRDPQGAAASACWCSRQGLPATQLRPQPRPAACTSTARSTSSICARNSRPRLRRRLFNAARRDLVQSGPEEHGDLGPVRQRAGDRVLSRVLGGRMVARSSEKFGPKSLDKVAFAWTN